MKLHHLRDVVAIADKGSLRAASRHLGLAQPAITRSVRELEHELGALLFERRTKGMVPTAVGEAFLRRVRSVQSDLERARDEVRQMSGSTVGHVSVGLSTAPHLGLLPRVIEPFHRRFPDVRLRVAEGLFPSMEAALRGGDLDFYLGPIARRDRHDDLLVDLLFENSRIIVARPGHPLAGARSLDELTTARWVGSTLSAEGDLDLAPTFARFGLPAPVVVVMTETALSTVAAVSSSDLLAMLPRQWLEFISRTRLLRRIPVREPLDAPDVSVVRRGKLPLTPAAEHLLDLLQRAAEIHARSPA